MPSLVAQIPAAPSDVALAHFELRLSLETDCSDVYESMRAAEGPDFVLIDTRGRASYARAHVPGAVSLPHREMTAERMAVYPADTLFVVYCNGPHCNAADRGAARLARLGRKVKVMIGGMAGWADEGFAVAQGEEPGAVTASAA